MKYIVYCRKSSESEDRQILSIESQIDWLLNLAEKEGIKIDKIYKESMSAKAPGRPYFDEMLTYIKKNKNVIILTWKLDRLSRNPVDNGNIAWLLQQGIISEIKTSERNYLPEDNVLLMSVEFGMANQYIRELSANVKRGNKTKLEKGGWTGRAPYGYTNDRLEKTVIIDSKTSRTVKRIFELYATGNYSTKEIEKIIYAEGGRGRKGDIFRKSKIHKLLRDSFYHGVMFRDGIYYKGNHEPLVSKDIFDQVQKIIVGKNHSRKNYRFFPYRGFMVCASCGCLITPVEKKGHTYYYCTNAKGNCDQHKIYLKGKEVEDLITNILDKINFDNELIEIGYQAQKEKIALQSKPDEGLRESLQNQLNEVKSRQNRLLEAYLSGIVSEQLHKEKFAKLSLEEKGVELQLALVAKKPANPLVTLERIKDHFLFANKVQNEFLNAVDERKRELLEKVLWNASVFNGNLAKVKLKQPYQVMADCPKNPTLLKWSAQGDLNPRPSA